MKKKKLVCIMVVLGSTYLGEMVSWVGVFFMLPIF